MPNNLLLYNKSLNICVFALSTTELSNDAKYICVVISESCPIPSLITEMGIFLLLAMLAHEWRALYNADIFVEIDAIKIIDNNEYQ